MLEVDDGAVARREMKVRVLCGVILLLAGCAADEPAAERYRGDALQAAYEIGQVQMSCPDATPMITSSQTTVPLSGSVDGAQLVYTANVTGCGEAREYVIVCREDGSGCAPGPR